MDYLHKVVLQGLVVLTIACHQNSSNSNAKLSLDTPSHSEGPGNLAKEETLVESVDIAQSARNEQEWKTNIADEIRKLKNESPAELQELLQLKPRKTRANTLRFIDKRLQHPQAAIVLLWKYAQDETPSEEREALIEALSRTNGPYAEFLPTLWASEQDDTVRSRIVNISRRCPDEIASKILKLGFEDYSPLVRASAARTTGKIGRQTDLDTMLLASLNDTDTSVQVAAIRSVKLLNLVDAKGSLDQLLKSTNPAIRLEALYSMERLAPEMLLKRSELETDSDRDVAKAAKRFRSRQKK